MGNEVVDSSRVCLQYLKRVLLHVLNRLFRPPMEANGPEELVDSNSLVSEYLTEPTLGGPPHALHLPEPVLRMHEPLSVHGHQF